MTVESGSQNYLEVSGAVLRQNARTVVDAVGCPVIGVVKCDGYGVSITEAAAAWKSCGVRMFAVAEPEEAMLLRNNGYQEEILLLAPVANALILDALLENNIILTVTSPACACFYSQVAGSRIVRAHIAVDTGMGRFGVRWDSFRELEAIYTVKNIQIEGIFSHFSASFEKKYSITKRQLARFLQTTEHLKKAGFPVGLRHIANSCAALRFPQTRLDAVRIGSALVGRLCAPINMDLTPVGVLRAMVVDRRVLRKGDRTGYGAICRVRRDMEVAIVAIGRQCGFGLEKKVECFRLWELLRGIYHMILAYHQGASVEWKGRKLPVVGRIGAQYTIVRADGTDLQPGDYVQTQPNSVLFPFRHRKYL